ncbi:acyl carrier protein [Streptomyces sp. PTM05]|uniref:Acyl carrier protein n=1 Tax=Streptantibioticus parmotrematis TaxID=2873249 RepID=A0ABS7QWG0_9ACTN|nr:acyl carrier protein [Streptantibioticus parmotrematis]MBY8886109.1 acyl carrier protein [Streptantibioticus parmotrematis]
MTKLYDEVKGCVARHFNLDPERIRPDTTLDELELDSLAQVELTCILQDELGLTVPQDTKLAPGTATFSELVTLVSGNAAPREPERSPATPGPSGNST